MAVIQFANVSKSFSRVTGQMLLRNHLHRWLKSSKHKEPFWALKNVSFKVDPGESVAIMGANGAGKSTLLSLIAGLARADEGIVAVNGRVAALLELGSGFHPELTGAENVIMNAALLGLSRKRTYELFDEMVEFSGIDEFIGEPLRTYSSGMLMRLAFAVATSMDPEILLIDEVLAVGDQAFQARCVERIHKLRQRGKTLVVVSHSKSLLQEFCDKAVWLDHGEVVMTGTLDEALEAYGGSRKAARQ